MCITPLNRFSISNVIFVFSVYFLSSFFHWMTFSFLLTHFFRFEIQYISFTSVGFNIKKWKKIEMHSFVREEHDNMAVFHIDCQSVEFRRAECRATHHFRVLHFPRYLKWIFLCNRNDWELAFVLCQFIWLVIQCFVYFLWCTGVKVPITIMLVYPLNFFRLERNWWGWWQCSMDRIY